MPEAAKRAWELASAIWSAIGAMGLDYALPPASFEYQGQKIRSPQQIADAGLATCLDLSLLFAAVFEQAGLHPIIVFVTGHAFVGVWLKDEAFSSTVVDDVTALRKRVQLKELVLLETTVVAQRPCPTFLQAIDAALRHIDESCEGSFELAVDVRRARLQRIRPLASADASTSVAQSDVPPPVTEPDFAQAPDLPDDDVVRTATAEVTTPKGRLALWQRKLLDLSLRNNLLNFKAGKKSLKLEAPEPGLLEDALAAGDPIKLLARPRLMEGSDPRSLQIHETRQREDLRRQHALDALGRKEVFVDLTAEELDERLVELYRAGRASLEEGGANTLYLALGFLCWTREDVDDKRFRAPLILIPISLNRRSVRSGFTLTLHEDEPRFNPTLIEMLRQDFKLQLEINEEQLPKDDSGLDVRAIWKQVALAIKEIKGWEVAEEAVLASFSFAKYLMWKDLAERTDQLKQNAVVRHLIETPREPFRGGAADTPFPHPRRLDVEYTPQQTLCPLPVDSSQLSAVMAAAGGKDFVLIGPPGTGKSQTIANVIAQCLAQNKRVLFVSEKIAALNVVVLTLAAGGAR